MNELLSQVGSKNRQLLDGIEAHNAAAFASSYYEADASLITPDGNAVNGLASITDFFGHFLQDSQNCLEVRPLADASLADASENPIVGTSGDLVCVFGSYAFALDFNFTGIPGFQGKGSDGSGKRVTVFRRHADGLKAVIDIFA